MNKTHKSIAFALSGAFALSVSAVSLNAAENPFAIKSLSSGYQVANHHEEKTSDGKCGEGKCGAEMMKETEHKTKDGKYGAEMKKDKSDQTINDKTKEGKCGTGNK